MAATLKKAVRTELDDIAAQLVRLDEEETKLKELKIQLKERFVQLAPKLERNGASVYWPVPRLNRRLRLTFTEGTPPVDWDRFSRIVGAELFLELCTVKTASLDVGLWNRAVAEERATDSQLQDCIGEAKPREPGLYVEKLPKNGTGPTS